MVNHNRLDREGQTILDAVIQLLSSLTLSLDDAHNLIRVVVDSTELQSPSTLETPQPPAPHPTTQIHLVTSPIVTPASTLQTPVPTAQTKSPTPLVVQTLQPPVSLSVPSSSILPTTTTTFNGEERHQQQYNSFTFDIPSADANGPFYLVNRGRHVGVFDTWPRTSPHVIGVKTSSYSRARSLYDGISRIMDAIDLGEAVWLP
ncbi:uncharacterized protein F5891DRAFT_1191992 [Suillus fuscotomentosus]|uniref:Ribonuclease H1 N-terminal domain-containing protein n=1 Tax=Suillus fuscotomentosus TaxID=1912939 RepID=A0AAD4HI32_9AGAM|nr:uncharacterized protein F5891DRAFT_1191992 [Suillus fuscotomentosus]KAG1897297.1 hypothetical protein F5891DRAFT_1191992 [Suillus fuscotomentosus]